MSRLNHCHVSTIVASQPLKRHGDLVYKFKVIVGKPYFSDQFKKIIKRYKKRVDINLKELLESLILVINLKRKYHYGIHMNIMRQSTCLMVNTITVYGYRFLFNCTTVCQTSDLMTALTYSLNPLIGA